MIRSIEKAVEVLAALSGPDPSLTLAEIADRLSLPKATAHRYASTLVDLGLAAQLEGGSYTLGFRLIEFGEQARAKFSLSAACMPIMRELAAATGETVMLSVADWPAGEKVTFERVDSRHALSTHPAIGRRTSIRSGLFGRAMLLGVPEHELAETLVYLTEVGGNLEPVGARPPTVGGARPMARQEPQPVTDSEMIAEIDRFRSLGYAREMGDGPYPDVSGVAVPVASQGGRPLGAIGILGPSIRVDQRIGELGALLAKTAEPLSATIERSPAPSDS